MVKIASDELIELQEWSKQQLLKKPDFIIGQNYLRRWWIVPRNAGCNVYLHEILHSDDDRALHDHPWSNTSYVLDGSYEEHTPDGIFIRTIGDIISRDAEASHRLVIPEGGRAVTLFFTGPVVRDWGFHCPNGWVHWKDFVDVNDHGSIGRGCGEH